jgi:O-antigen ligase
MTLALPRWLADGALPFATAVVLVLALVLGGGSLQGRWTDAIVELASLPLLALALFSLDLTRVARGPIILVCLIVALPLLQLVPLPPALWSALPGREQLIQGYSAAGLSLPWLPISVDPNATWRSLCSLLPPVAVFLAVLQIPNGARRNLVLVILAVAFLSIVLGMLQMMAGESSDLRFYENANLDRAVGFFVNSNHFAAFLYCAIPFAAAWSIGFRHQRFRTFLVVVLLGAVAAGLGIAQSRAGLILSVVAGLSSIALVMRDGSSMPRKRLLGVIAGGSAIVLLIAFQFGFVSMSQRVQETALMRDQRWPVAAITLKLAETNLPFGTGLGTFVPVYQTVEPRTMISDHYMNRAHDDWLELALEGGLLSLFVLLVFLAWFVRSSCQIWRPRQSGTDPNDIDLARAGSIVVLLLMLHSIVDFPLRTIAMTVEFAIACALLIPPNLTDRMRQTYVDPPVERATARGGHGPARA